MSTSKNSNLLHKQQSEAAQKQFEQYKEFIVDEFVSKFGTSYQMPKDYMENWRKVFAYSPERVAFIKEKTKYFIRLLPTDQKIYASPKFFHVLLNLICDYLSVYTSRTPENETILASGKYINRSTYRDSLLQELLDNNTYINTRIKEYMNHNQKITREWTKTRRSYISSKKEANMVHQQRKELVTFGTIPSDERAWHTHEEYVAKLRQIRDLDKKIAQHDNRS